MGILEQILAQVDNAKRVAGKNTKDFIENPADFLAMVTGRVKEKSDKLASRDPEVLNELIGNAIPGGGAVGATVFHGTPYRFAPTAKNTLGEFLDKYIGSGEGAQVYGMGHYVAGAKGTAQEYAKMGNKQEILGRASALERSLANPRLSVEEARQIREQVVSLRNKAKAMPDSGTVYSVDLPDSAIANMLDWDKPLSQQPDILAALGISTTKLPEIKLIGGAGDSVKSLTQYTESALAQRAGKTGVTEEERLAAVKLLNSKGIPGIKYLDQKSRDLGEGTSNYVVFDPNLLKILGIEE